MVKPPEKRPVPAEYRPPAQIVDGFARAVLFASIISITIYLMLSTTLGLSLKDDVGSMHRRIDQLSMQLLRLEEEVTDLEKRHSTSRGVIFPSTRQL